MNFDRILRGTLLVGLFLVPFIPFIVTNSMFFPFITGKNFTFRILVEVLFGLWLILALRNSAYRPRFSWTWIALAVFVGIVLIADLHGANPMKSIWSNFERMDGWITLGHLLAYFFVIGTVLNTEKLWMAFFNTTVGASVLMGLYGLIQLSGHAVINQGGVRVDGKFGNATYLAIYMLIHIFITLILLYKWRGGYLMRYVYGAVILLQAFILYYTATRGAILGLIGGLFLSALLIAIFERGRPLLRKISIGVVLATIVIVGGFFIGKDSNFVRHHEVLSRFATISPNSGTVQARFTIWNMAWQGVKERPVLGWGQENFNLVFNKYFNPVLYADEPWFDRTHDIFFDWLIAGGLSGLISYFAIPLVLLYYIWFSRRGQLPETEKNLNGVRGFLYRWFGSGGSDLSITEKSLLTGLLAGYLFHNIFVFDNLVSYIMYIIIIAYVYAMTKGEQKTGSIWNRELDQGTVNRVASPLIIISIIFLIYFVNVKSILANTTLIDAIRQQSNPQQNIMYFKEALAYNAPIGTQEIREQLIQSAARAAVAQGLDPTVKSDMFNLASTEMDKQIATAADDARLVLFQGSLYDAYGKYSEAEKYFERAHELSPNKQSISFALAQNLIRLNHVKDAQQLLKETADLEPSDKDAWAAYAASLVYGNDVAGSDKILSEHFGTTVVDNNQLLQAYINQNMWTRVRDAWELRVERNPSNTQYHLALAATYLKLEERQKSIEEIQKVIDLNPDFKDQGEYLISEIKAGRNP